MELTSIPKRRFRKAELLIRVKPHHGDNLSKKDIDEMSAKEKIEYESRFQIGDVVCVKPAGWRWGKAERKPNFMVIRCENLLYKEALQYQEPLCKEIEFENQEEVDKKDYIDGKLKDRETKGYKEEPVIVEDKGNTLIIKGTIKTRAILKERR